MFIKKIASIAALSLSAIASISYAGSAHALGFTYSAGAYRDSAVKNQGAFSEQVNNKGYTTLDFNDGKAPNSDGVKYTFSQGTYSTTALSGQTGIYSDKWAPSGVVGTDVNYSNYLAVFKGNTVTIENTKNKVFNYFGFDAGALSGGNTLSFFKGGTLVKELTYDIMNAAAKVSSSTHGGQLNGFFEFFSEGVNDNFDKIVLSQNDGGGFESDNHTFRTGTGKYDAAKVPEPGVALGLLAVGGIFLRKRKNQKSVNLG
ncbi:PEP-CTERM sorting domain-containing protein [Scytonema hofmannii FACHB-248]|uniref:PEP-CTERM sorting domain-containing protein n=2 Tax=Cyanophyceae TaxID=3028117 RepID=A0ABR8GSW3_9CYAN|nr:PEP-CTERM sorting domain-containing protein [Scytonema hofmannii FACHB-248]